MIEIDDEFFSVMAEVAGGSQVKQVTELSHRIGMWSISNQSKICDKIWFQEMNMSEQNMKVLTFL